ncbi:hypothetical protein LCGC14_2100570 [marine sediment metagenome]|uniref:Uncharacterized protein n=1 Tax=marine sediment metagenome TaxID=412755 RepID=A0A0F9GN84_9ZZZZ
MKKIKAWIINRKEGIKMVKMMKRYYNLLHGFVKCPKCASTASTYSHRKNYEINARCNNCNIMFVI